MNATVAAIVLHLHRASTTLRETPWPSDGVFWGLTGTDERTMFSRSAHTY
jgi:hypothetical protein